MSTAILSASETSCLSYKDFTHTIATVTANGTADEVGNPTSSIYRASWDRSYSPAHIQRSEIAWLFDLSSIPPNSRIISGSLAISTTGTTITSGSPSSTNWRLVGPGDANDPIEVDDLRPIDDAPPALAADWAYNDASPDIALTASGVAHVQAWLTSDGKVKFTTMSVSALNGDDPYTDNFRLVPYEWDDATLTIVYEESTAGLLGCNF